MIVVVLLVVLFATIIGAITGLGGGLIIKPLLVGLGVFTPVLLNFYSSSAVFAMTTFSVIKRRSEINNEALRLAIKLAIGAFIGGIIGNITFSYLLTIISSNNVIIIQTLILIILFIFIITYTVKKITIKRKFTSTTLQYFIGVISGIIAAFIGIGGGSLNVFVLTVLFKQDFKQATLNSLIIILFAQFSNLATFAITGVAGIEYLLLTLIVIVSLVGALIGKQIVRLLTQLGVERAFVITLFFVLFLNILIIFQYNIF